MNNFFFLALTEITDPCKQGWGLSNCPEGGDKTSITNLANQIVSWITIAIGILSILFIIISAIQIITSGGDAEKVKRARRTLLYSIIGLIVAVLANVIISLVFNAATEVTR